MRTDPCSSPCIPHAKKFYSRRCDEIVDALHRGEQGGRSRLVYGPSRGAPAPTASLHGEGSCQARIRDVYGEPTIFPPADQTQMGPPPLAEGGARLCLFAFDP